MGLAGEDGPVRGAYNNLTFATNAFGATSGNVGPEKQLISIWTAPFDLVIHDVQAYTGAIGTNTRVNLLASGASVLHNGTNDATANGVGLTAGNVVQCTPSTGVFGLTSTNIILPSTPSNRVTPRFGAYVLAGATISATYSNGATQVTNSGFVMNIGYFPVSHPAMLRSAFE